MKEDKNKKFRESMRYMGEYPFDAEELLLRDELKTLDTKYVNIRNKTKSNKQDRVKRDGDDSIKVAVEEIFEK